MRTPSVGLYHAETWTPNMIFPIFTRPVIKSTSTRLYCSEYSLLQALFALRILLRILVDTIFQMSMRNNNSQEVQTSTSRNIHRIRNLNLVSYDWRTLCPHYSTAFLSTSKTPNFTRLQQYTTAKNSWEESTWLWEDFQRWERCRWALLRRHISEYWFRFVLLHVTLRELESFNA